MNLQLKYFIAAVWVINGLFCKVLNLTPRHQEIVSRILGSDYSEIFTILIGFSEVIMAIWILSNYKSKFNAMTQIIVVLTMNILEFILVPEMLLWGRYNILFAIIFCSVVYVNEFQYHKKVAHA